jgi:phosphatidylglycerophosphatase A
MTALKHKINLWRDPVHFLSVGFGIGTVPVAPGTFGTLIAIPFYLLLQHLPLVMYGMIVLVAALVGIWLCDKTAKALGEHDHPSIVWDEMVGYWLTMFAAPKGWVWVILGFGLFRLFDIWKPWPIGWVDRHVSGGFGIMFDDILAAVYAGLILQVIAYFVLR